MVHAAQAPDDIWLQVRRHLMSDAAVHFIQQIQPFNLKWRSRGHPVRRSATGLFSRVFAFMAAFAAVQDPNCKFKLNLY
jgi:hypothetical protein